jgi:uncharacterized protein (DUF1778 family)
MVSAIAKQDRIGARVPHEVYQTLCRAAELTGATVNQFLVQAALKRALFTPTSQTPWYRWVYSDFTFS